MKTDLAKWSPPLCSEPGVVAEFEKAGAAAAVVDAPGQALPGLLGLGTDAFCEQIWLSADRFTFPYCLQLALYLQQT